MLVVLRSTKVLSLLVIAICVKSYTENRKTCNMWNRNISSDKVQRRIRAMKINSFLATILAAILLFVAGGIVYVVVENLAVTFALSTVLFFLIIIWIREHVHVEPVKKREKNNPPLTTDPSKREITRQLCSSCCNATPYEMKIYSSKLPVYHCTYYASFTILALREENPDAHCFGYNDPH